MTTLLLGDGLMGGFIISGLLLVVGGVIVFLAMRRPTPAHGATTATLEMTEPLSLGMILDRLAGVGDDEQVFLDRSNNAFVKLTDGERAVLESNEPLDEQDTEDRSAKEHQRLRGLLRSKRLVALPTKTETREHELREAFVEDLPDGDAKVQLLKALAGQTGFRSFGSALERVRLEEAWRRRRDAAFGEVVRDWARRHGISLRGETTTRRLAS